METLKWKIFRIHTCMYARTRISWSCEGRVSQITWFEFYFWLAEWRCHLSRENQSLWFCWALSSFLFFSRLILSESLLYFTGMQSLHFPNYSFSFFSIYLSWLALFFLYAQVRVFAMWHLVHAVLLRLRTKGKNCLNGVFRMELNVLQSSSGLSSLHKSQEPALILVSVAWSDWESFYSPLDGMLVHRGVTPDIKLAGIHVYTWVERGTVRVKGLAQEHNTMSPARAGARTARRRAS